MSRCFYLFGSCEHLAANVALFSCRITNCFTTGLNRRDFYLIMAESISYCLLCKSFITNGALNACCKARFCTCSVYFRYCNFFMPESSYCSLLQEYPAV